MSRREGELMAKSVPGGWKASLAAVLKTHNRAKQDGSVASHATQDKRADVLYAGFKLLRDIERVTRQKIASKDFFNRL